MDDDSTQPNLTDISRAKLVHSSLESVKMLNITQFYMQKNAKGFTAMTAFELAMSYGIAQVDKADNIGIVASAIAGTLGVATAVLASRCAIIAKKCENQKEAIESFCEQFDKNKPVISAAEIKDNQLVSMVEIDKKKQVINKEFNRYILGAIGSGLFTAVEMGKISIDNPDTNLLLATAAVSVGCLAMAAKKMGESTSLSSQKEVVGKFTQKLAQDAVSIDSPYRGGK